MFLLIPALIFTIKEIADRLSPGVVRFSHSLAFVRVHRALGYFVTSFGGAAVWAAVGKTRFIWLQLEFFRADDAGSDGKYHAVSMI